MKRSLSLILPVRNAEQTLAQDIGRILEILPDLTRNFEILIVDQGSSDQTLEMAEDLAMEYPQIRVAIAAPGQAVTLGVQVARGETVITHDGTTMMNAEQIQALCQEFRPQATPMGIGREPLSRQKSWRRETNIALKPVQGSSASGFQLLEREQIDRLRRSVAAVQKLTWQTEVSTQMVREIPQSDQANRRPNYLTQIKERLGNLTWGE